VLVGLEGDVVKTLQSIKKGIELLDTRRTDLRAGEQDEPQSEDGVEDDSAVEVEDDEGLTATARR
jgi:hypothetical protein